MQGSPARTPKQDGPGIRIDVFVTNSFFVTTSKAPVTTSEALVTNSFFVTCFSTPPDGRHASGPTPRHTRSGRGLKGRDLRTQRGRRKEQPRRRARSEVSQWSSWPETLKTRTYILCLKDILIHVLPVSCACVLIELSLKAPNGTTAIPLGHQPRGTASLLPQGFSSAPPHRPGYDVFPRGGFTMIHPVRENTSFCKQTQDLSYLIILIHIIPGLFLQLRS